MSRNFVFEENIETIEAEIKIYQKQLNEIKKLPQDHKTYMNKEWLMCQLKDLNKKHKKLLNKNIDQKKENPVVNGAKLTIKETIYD